MKNNIVVILPPLIEKMSFPAVLKITNLEPVHWHEILSDTTEYFVIHLLGVQSRTCIYEGVITTTYGGLYETESDPKRQFT